MARPKRIDIPYCLYHVHSRTNSGDAAFRDKKDKEKFLYYLRKYLDLLSLRIGQYDKGQGRASQARNKRDEHVRKKEQKKADEIVRTLANHFGLSVEMMKTGRRLKGKGAIARKALIVLFLENLPWTHKQLAKYIGLNGSNAITYHLTTVKGNQKLTGLINVLRRLVINGSNL